LILLEYLLSTTDHHNCKPKATIIDVLINHEEKSPGFISQDPTFQVLWKILLLNKKSISERELRSDQKLWARKAEEKRLKQEKLDLERQEEMASTSAHMQLGLFGKLSMELCIAYALTSMLLFSVSTFYIQARHDCELLLSLHLVCGVD